MNLDAAENSVLSYSSIFSLLTKAAFRVSFVQGEHKVPGQLKQKFININSIK